jgi:5-methylcytosine-specific restriction enzyme A
VASGRWASSRRRDTLPSNWSMIRRRVLTRDRGECQIRAAHCEIVATDVDHIGDPADHRDGNLRAACGDCHRQRSARQGADASTRARRALAAARYRPTEPHPGLIGDQQ